MQAVVLGRLVLRPSYQHIWIFSRRTLSIFFKRRHVPSVKNLSDVLLIVALVGTRSFGQCPSHRLLTSSALFTFAYLIQNYKLFDLSLTETYPVWYERSLFFACTREEVPWGTWNMFSIRTTFCDNDIFQFPRDPRTKICLIWATKYNKVKANFLSIFNTRKKIANHFKEI